jgi:peptide/nickel transport system permease protein
MVGFIGRRALEAIPVLVVLTLLIFALFRLIPGDYLAEMEMNPAVSPETVERLRADFGLDRSVPAQFGIWLSQLARGNLGYSFAQRRPALDLIRERLGRTLALTAAAFSLSLLVALPLGCLAAAQLGRWPDRLCLWGSLIGLSLPSVLSSLLFLYFAFWVGRLPGGEPGTITGVVLPAVTLAIPASALLTRTLRLEMAHVLTQPYIAAAVARGLPRWRVLWHAFRNGVNPVISLAGVTLGGMLSGAVVVEKVFSWPGLGALVVDSILARDLYVALGAVLIAAVFVIAANFAADLLLAVNDPRVRRP